MKVKCESILGGAQTRFWGQRSLRSNLWLFIAALALCIYASKAKAWTSPGDSVAWFGDTPALTLNATPFGSGAARFSAAGASTASTGATITMVSLLSPSASVNRANNITATSLAQAITNSNYYFANLTVAGQGLLVSGMRFNARAENTATARMTVSYYDTVTATETFTDATGTLIASASGTSPGVTLPMTNAVSLVPGRMYQVRFYFWNCGASKQCYIDNPVISTSVNENPTAQNDAFTISGSAGVSGGLYANNGSGADTDVEGQALTVDQINGASFTVGNGITLANGTLTITNATTGAFNFVSAGPAFTTQTFTYRINDGFGGTSSATVTITDARAVLTARKISTGGVGAFTFAGTNGFGADTITTVTAGAAVNGVGKILAANATATTLTETIPTGWIATAGTCSGTAAGNITFNGNATATTATIALKAAATSAGNAASPADIASSKRKPSTPSKLRASAFFSAVRPAR